MEDKRAAGSGQGQPEQKAAGETPWRPFLIGNRMRTTSEDSAESYDAYNLESPSASERRFSITERFFGPSKEVFRERRSSTSEVEIGPGGTTKNIDLKQFMKRQRKILGDDEWQ